MEYPSLDKPTAGATRFNTDSAQLEIYDGNQWTGVLATSPEQQTGGTRGVFIGGSNGTGIDYINVATTGNAVNFVGVVHYSTSNLQGTSDRTRAVFSGGYGNEINKLEMTSLGDSSDFGDLNAARGNVGGCADRTRGLFMGGYSPSNPGGMNNIDYVTIQSDGTGKDFGDVRDRWYLGAGFSSPTRGIFSGADSTPGTIGKEHIDYVTIATLGNSADFGDQSEGGTWQRSAASNAVRGLIMGGRKSPTETNSIDYITIATLGNAIDFGDLNRIARYEFALASSTRAVNAGGYRTSPAGSNDTIDYVQIATTGNAVDFGNLVVTRNKGASASNGHGGL